MRQRCLSRPGLRPPVLLCLFAGLAVSAVWAADPPRYALGEIPPIRVYYGESGAEVTFDVEATELAGEIEYSVAADPVPEGPLGIDAATGRFVYQPSADDDVPFLATIEGRAGEAVQSQAVSIHPTKPIPPESEVFSESPVGELPAQDDPDFIDVQDTPRAAAEIFNAQGGVHPRDIAICGIQVVFEPGHPNGLWSLHDNKDIGSLTVLADSVVIRGPLRLPQTDVTIKALSLTFEDGEGEPASLSTVPVNSILQPAKFADGRHGHKGGSLSLHVLDYEAPGDRVRFDLSGGDGERAGQGQAGSKGASRSPVTRINNGLLQATFKASDGVIWVKWDGLVDTYAPQKSKTAWPGNGTDAKAGGKPGDGGDGGDVESTVDLFASVKRAGGKAGTRASTQSGGDPGTPRPAWRLVINSKGTQSSESRSASFGSSAAGPFAAKSAGTSGVATLLDDSIGWLAPAAMEKVLGYLQDAYLNRHCEYVRETVPLYLELFAQARTAEAYAALPFEARSSLEQIRAELLSMQHRLGSNLDFFGNPAGWVPMLSFEVNKLAFENEIARALKIQYVSYWLGKKAQTLSDQQEALETLREELIAAVEEAKKGYEETIAKVPGLEFQAREVQRRIDEATTKIRNLEAELLPKARDVALLKKTARAVGAVAQIFPVGQPYVGAAGSVLSALPDIDPNKPWEENALAVGTNAAGSFAESQANIKLAKLLDESEGVDPSNEEIAEAAFSDMQLAQDPVLDFLSETYDNMSNSQSPSPEVQAELQRLLADEPEFRKLESELVRLNRDKEEFANQLAFTLQQATNFSLEISRGTLVIDAFNKQILANSQVIDPRTQSLLESMGRDAKYRLLKYHYFLAKAYEYRLLRPYEPQLDLGKIQDKFQELAEGPDGDDLSATDFALLSAPYDEQVSALAFEILDDYNSNPAELSLPFEFSVPQSVIERVNAGEIALYNLFEDGLFPLSHENLRIVQLEVADVEMEYVGDEDNIVFTEIVMQHSGVSRLSSDSESFLFRHYNESARSKIQWIGAVSVDGAINPVSPSEASSSMLKTLLTTGGSPPPPEDLLLYSRPAANADLLMSMRVNRRNNAIDSQVVIKSMKLRLRYDFFERRSNVSTLQIVGLPGGPAPEVRIGVEDLGGRGDGLGSFQRQYNIGASVPIQAPERLGQYEFVRWEGAGVQDAKAPATFVVMGADTSVSPVYALAGEAPAAPRLVNISTRGQVLAGDSVMIAGFVIGGDEAMDVIVRASGPGLDTIAENLIGQTIADPKMSVFRQASPPEKLEDADNWEDGGAGSALADAYDLVGAFPFEPGSDDAAIEMTLQPGAYTSIVSGVGGATGLSLVEVYDKNAQDDPDCPVLLENISTRADVGAGDAIVIAGFVIEGEAPLPVLVRGVGPTLESQNVAGFLEDPRIRVFDGSNAEILANDDWEDNANAAEIAATAGRVGAFALPSGSADAALLAQLDPGLYTVLVSGVGGGSGIVLVEVYAAAE